MRLIYNIAIIKVRVLIFILKFFNSKIRSFNNQRKNVIKKLESSISKNDNHIWIHVASLGEYEQGLPIFKEIKSLYKNHKIILSFFSSSGYEVQKNNSIGDLTIYLPLDSPSNAKKLISIVNPKMAFFVKYEFWPNYLYNLKKNNTPTYLLAGLFRKNHWFFKWYGSGFLNLLKSSITHFFVQNKESKNLLSSHNITNCTLMGDSRFDRVNSLPDQNNEIKNIKEFIGDKICFVAGSTWKEDEYLIIDSINVDIIGDIYEVIKSLPASKIVGYAGRSTYERDNEELPEGVIETFAENQRMIGDYYETFIKQNGYGQNYVDVPVIMWLSRQPKPRMLVTDMEVVALDATRKGSHVYTEELIEMCEQLCIKHDIIVIADVDEAIEYAKHISNR